ncbi:hypothetical protein LGQ03_07210 [Loktanella sp. TSTF-M6]|uniref:Uncharacterized protein n=1 Tax=Loktanella gaetbuli TaxID=2881335 RepID=A0ABS8BTF0_9RHOB|nr:hypothetical protein [Loktanella gaetbuli]MCB5199024.1 hypothetical protein [Loktanella gaetbuli]
MTTVFDGIAGALTGIFGDSVIVEPQGQPRVTVRGMVRLERVEVSGEAGQAVVDYLPVFKVPRTVLLGLSEGDLVIAPDGRRYLVSYEDPNESPATDRFRIYILREEY